MRTTKSYLLIFVLLTSCLLKDKNSSTNESSLPNQVVLIFKDFPKDYSIKLNDTKGKAYSPARPRLTYYDNHLIQRTLKPKTETVDTIIISCNQSYIEFQHNVKGIDNFDYIFQKGDTIIFSYTDKIPTAKIINRLNSDFEINYDLRLREIVYKNDYPALTKIMIPFMFITYNSNYIGQEGERSGILGHIDKIRSNAQLRFKKEIELEKNFLDSLLNNTLLSNKTYKWLNQKLEIKKAIVKAYNNDYSRNEVKAIVSQDLDSLLSHHSYRNLVTNISSTFYDRKIKRIVSSNSNLPDYKIVYDSIFNSNLFSSKTKEMLLFETSNLLMQNSSASEINTHLNKIKSNIKDSLLISFLVDEYGLKNQLSDELQLVDLEGNKTTLSRIIKENPGKVVYFDFWASWCAPCIAEFPQSKILTEKLKGKNIIFIYLSVDDDRNRWQTSSKKHNLPVKYSFLIQNKKTSKFLEKIDFSSIPRYLLFNKTGYLEYINAPRPSDGETIKIIEGLLKE